MHALLELKKIFNFVMYHICFFNTVRYHHVIELLYVAMVTVIGILFIQYPLY